MNIYKYNLKGSKYEYNYVVAGSYAIAESLIEDKYEGCTIHSIEQINDNGVLIEGKEQNNDNL